MDVLILAFRYLRTRLVAIISLLFIAVGVTANIVVNAVMDGFRIRIIEHVRNVQSDLTLDFKDYRLRGHLKHAHERLKGEMSDAGGPIVAMAPRHREIGLAACLTSDGRYDYERKAPVYILGVDWPMERRVMPIERMLAAVDVDPFSAHLAVPPERRADPFKDRALPAVVVGSSLAKRLGLRRGGELDLVVADLSEAAGKARFDASNLRFEVAGCYDTGNDEYDGWNVYIAREDYERLKGAAPTRDCATIQVKLVDGEDAAAVKDRLLRTFASERLLVETWEDENITLLAAVKNERAMIVIILSFIILIAAGSIMGILVMMVIEKTRDVGVLRSMGMSAMRTTAVFWTAGSVLGFIGVSAGVAMGVAMVRNLNAITTGLHDHFGIEVFNAKVYKFKEIPAVLLPEWVAGVALGAFSCAMIASLIPAWLVSRLDPVKCLKHE